jgi:hypothetical protein
MLQSVYETSQDLSGLSEWSHHLDIVRSLARRQKPVFFYLPVPKRSDRIRYADALFDLPNVQVLPYEHEGYFLMPAEWLKWLSVYRNLPFDVVWNDCWWHNTVVAVALRSSTTVDPPVLVNAFYESPRAPELRAHGGQPLVDLQMIGGALQDHAVVLTSYHRSLLLEVARQYVGASVLRELDEHVDVLPPAVDTRLIDQHRLRFDQERRARGELVVFVAGGLSEAKRRFTDIAKVVKRLRDTGHPIKMKARTQSPASRRRGKQLEELGVEVEYECSRSRYLENLGDADVVVDATTDETTGLANVEAVLSGAVYVPVRQPWMEGRVPDDYPLAVSGWSDLEALLAVASKDKRKFVERFQGDVEGLERHYRSLFSSDGAADRFVGILEKLLERPRAHRISRSFDLLVGQAVEGVTRLSLSDLYRRMREHAKSQAVDWSSGTKHWNSLVARRALENRGFRDLCNGPEPLFVKEESCKPQD